MQRTIVAVLVVLVSLCAATSSRSAPQAKPGMRRVAAGTTDVKDVIGTAQQRKGATGAWKKLHPGDILTTDTTVKTDANSALLLQLWGGHMFRVGESSTVELRELGKANSFSFHVLAGNIWSVVRQATRPTKYEVETPSVVAGVSGTLFAVFYDAADAQSIITADEGVVKVRQLDDQLKATGEPVSVSKDHMIQMGRALVTTNNNVPSPPGSSAKAGPQPPALRQMWTAMRMHEGWINPLRSKTPFRLNSNVEPAIRMMALRRKRANSDLPARAQRRPPVRRHSGQRGRFTP